MKCYQISKQGGPFELVERPIPKPGEGQILIKLIHLVFAKVILP
jgi:NADPH:quinone reductase-like Zn-dependent oxidoreductase